MNLRETQIFISRQKVTATIRVRDGWEHAIVEDTNCESIFKSRVDYLGWIIWYRCWEENWVRGRRGHWVGMLLLLFTVVFNIHKYCSGQWDSKVLALTSFHLWVNVSRACHSECGPVWPCDWRQLVRKAPGQGCLYSSHTGCPVLLKMALLQAPAASPGKRHSVAFMYFVF